jgi:CRISPR type III-B/RAMP module RAMP protein Cmr6
MPAPILREIEPLLREVESASLRHAKLVSTLANATKRNEIEAVTACHAKHARRIPAVTPSGAVTLFAKLEGRLIVNQAGGILENAGISLHPHFNDPFIPGSAVKGIARHAAWCEWIEAADSAEKIRIARDIAAVFGFPTGDKSLDVLLNALGFDSATAGSVAFLPAFPHAKKPAIVTDITNSHHMKYYGSDDPSAVALDNEEPNPQFFPAVESGAVFRFTLVPLSRASADVHATRARAWLLSALTLHGAGAKTAAGYGWFSYDATESDRIAQAEIDERRKRQEDQAFLDEKAALPDLDVLPPESLTPAIATCETFLKKWEGREGLQSVRDHLGKIRSRLPQQSPLDKLRERWAAQSEKATINGDIKQFAKKPEDEKKAIVEILHEPGNPIWQTLRSGQKGDIATAVEAIRAYCKNTLNLGKMP